jgi:hypothetical protein
MKTRLFTLLAGLLFLFAPSVGAQSRDPYFTDLSANYDVVYHEENATSNAGAHFDVASTFKRDVPYIGPVGEVGFNHFDSATVVSVMGGARIRIPDNTRRILPYAQVLAGLYHCGVCNTNNFAIQGGGGLDFRMSGNDYRIRTQLDVRHVSDPLFGFNAVRFSVGIVLPLNK